MHRSEPSRLQSLALQLADKINNFVDSNERILETKQGNFFLRGGNQVRKRMRQSRTCHSMLILIRIFFYLFTFFFLFFVKKGNFRGDRQNYRGNNQDWNRQRRNDHRKEY